MVDPDLLKKMGAVSDAAMPDLAAQSAAGSA
jgi:hypothetical protein